MIPIWLTIALGTGIGIGIFAQWRFDRAAIAELRKDNDELYEAIDAALALAQKLNTMTPSRGAHGRFAKRKAL